MNIKVRIRSLKDASLIGAAARAMGVTTEELARISLYKEVNSIIALLRERRSAAGHLNEGQDNASTGNTEGNPAEVPDGQASDSAALADQKEPTA